MKTILRLSAALAFVLLAARTFAANDAVATAWQAELAAAQQATHQDAGGRARADLIVQTVLTGVWSGIEIPGPSGSTIELPPAGASREAAAAHAAYAVMAVLYPDQIPALDTQLAGSLAGIVDTPSAIAAGKQWGEHVAAVVLARSQTALYLNANSFVAAAKAPAGPPAGPDVHAAEAAIGAGRYRFTVLAGDRDTKGHVDGAGAAARFDNPGTIAVDAAGNIYLSEESLCTVRKITPTGVVTTLAGTPGQRGSQDGVGAAAQFNQPRGVAVDFAGNVYVADMGNHTVRKIDPSGRVTTLAGSAGKAGSIDGLRSEARFDNPAAIAVDDAGNVFVADWGGIPKIRRITPDGTVAKLEVTITSGPWGATWPSQLRVDHAGNLYSIFDDLVSFTDAVKLVPTGGLGYAVTTLHPPGSARYAGGIGLDDAGNLYVWYDLGPLVVFTPDGAAEVRHVTGYPAGYWWKDMTADRLGRILALPAGPGATIEVGTYDTTATGPSILVQPNSMTMERGMNVSFSVTATGTSTLAYQWYFNGSPVGGATQSTLSLTNLQDGHAGSYAVVVTDSGGSVTSRTATLSVNGPPAPPGPAPVNPTAKSGGGGAVSPAFALAVLGLLAAAERRRHRRAPAAPDNSCGASRPAR